MAPYDNDNYTPNENSNSFLSLDHDSGFIWDFEEAIVPMESIQPTRWSVVEHDD